jgi:hypothetical protein
MGALEPAELKAEAQRAVDGVPHARDWARKYLESARLGSARFTANSAEALVHTATVGISLACVPDADSRLARLLEQCIAALEQLTQPESVSAVVIAREPATA